MGRMRPSGTNSLRSRIFKRTLTMVDCVSSLPNDVEAAFLAENTLKGNTSQTATSSLYRTKLCEVFMEKRVCKLSCPYAHSTTQLREKPDFRKTRMCAQWKDGNCARGVSCDFAHGRAQLVSTDNVYKTRLCNWFIGTGKCIRGAACRHAHAVAELRSAREGYTRPKDNRNVYAI